MVYHGNSRVIVQTGLSQKLCTVDNGVFKQINHKMSQNVNLKYSKSKSNCFLYAFVQSWPQTLVNFGKKIEH